ncbi:hypothetical protein Bca52824_025056 [Brassica carinata]|uniref:Uncharacterized protein n=1 Tax=Brassica carinata TaxID=52824 RepID=A0A8X7VL57_BRACI|nr:hypothetical protein Bca52824_025056 [Brassica carinata]
MQRFDVNAVIFTHLTSKLACSVNVHSTYRLNPFLQVCIDAFAGSLENKLTPLRSGSGFYVEIRTVSLEGSLEDHTFTTDDLRIKPLSWTSRVKVAVAAAKELARLDFGLARDCPKGEISYVITRVMGTFGYAALECVYQVSTEWDARRFSRKSGIDK